MTVPFKIEFKISMKYLLNSYLGEKYHRGKAPFLYQRYTYQRDLLLLTLTLMTYLPEVLFIWFLHCEVPLLSLPFHALLFKRKSLCVVHTTGVDGYSTPPWGQSMYINNLGFFCKGDLSVLSHLLMYLFNHFFTSIWRHAYFILWVII